jgi:hypothetical protein
MELFATTPWLRFGGYAVLFLLWLCQSIEYGDSFWSLWRRVLPVVLSLTAVEVAGYWVPWPKSIPLALPWSLWGIFVVILLVAVIFCARSATSDKGLGLFVLGCELAVVAVLGVVLYFMQRSGSVTGLLRATVAMALLLAVLGGSAVYEVGKDWMRKRRPAAAVGISSQRRNGTV